MSAAENAARAFAPGNVSCVFKVVAHDDPARMHSLGMGFTVSDGVIATVTRAEAIEITFNARPIEFPTVRSVIDALTDRPVRVALETPLPLSGGFGLSGASALATAYALDALLGLGRERSALALAAHVAEVRNLTGLGDVAGQYHGGCNVKLESGDPLAAAPLPVPDRDVWYRYYSPIHTRDVIGDPESRSAINAAADAALERLARLRRDGESDFIAYVTVARTFAEDSGLLRDGSVRAAIAEVEANGGHASMIMLGNAVFATAPFEGSTRTRLARRGAEVVD